MSSQTHAQVLAPGQPIGRRLQTVLPSCNWRAGMAPEDVLNLMTIAALHIRRILSRHSN